eukprot:Gregarina_sp_Poly_1__1044@NODE_1256_length_4606_cov_243_164794_g589_i1_p3_GENE_NODE_1256_length_4606_cov_243_164794_g589_i1NODE_1256_length_4606_cov_243_164794_g589_i1_p3_ORF_typecomplete_len192_score42_40PEARLI4/PF05278_12/0_0014Taxilin/PF09728_9/0_015Spc7/PF08317_11/0_023Peptidase_M2/PF01401_18/0_049DUF16/PF01519_16/0_12zfRING_13/PF17977_1/0_26_NODE_1256_length_4606_cov_243_164794_g589_i163638
MVGTLFVAETCRAGHCAATSLYNNCPLFFGGADAYASAQSNLSWRVEILPSASQISKLFEKKCGEDEERRKVVRDFNRFQEEVRMQGSRLAMQEKETAYWRSRFEETALALDMMGDRLQTVERQCVQLSNVIEEFEPLVHALRAFSVSVLNVASSGRRAANPDPLLENMWKKDKAQHSPAVSQSTTKDEND